MPASNAMLTYAPWRAVPGLAHGFLGQSECAGAAGWDAGVARAGVPLPVVTARQVHGTRVETAAAGPPRQADGLVSATDGQLLGVVTADCMPVLLIDRQRRAAAAVHAGWRGAAGGVLEAAVAKLGAAFQVAPRALEAAVGPAVGACCYEVGDEVLDAFRARVGDLTAPAWSHRGGRLHLDLRAAARLLLRDAGVGRVAVLGPCTACGSGYCSYRRDGAGAGRQLSFVGWVSPPVV
ncbi:MAG: peptidoglycan editing factor PgeF [Deltaproteobacteria bacterium]|nr:MAG: peptidoglycan editing factor PgeF [Deltaproteobacteria bacterium]